jgi:serine/threonine protein kinase
VPDPKQFGRYEIVRLLGRGGMGVVYLAHQIDLDRPVVVKVIHPDLARDPLIVARLAREARAAARINSDFVVRVYDSGTENGVPFIAMEYVDGPAASVLLKARGRLPHVEATRLVLAAARGIKAAHDEGILHRDVKPANILISKQGRVKVADFGIARLEASALKKPGAAGSAGETLSMPGEIVGSPDYMAPEQVTGEELDARSDIYSLGVSYYELLTGRKPFSGSTALHTLMLATSAPLPPPRSIVPELPEHVERVCLALMARERDRRPATAQAAIDLLQPLASGRGPAVSAPTASSARLRASAAPLARRTSSRAAPAAEPPSAAEPPPRVSKAVIVLCAVAAVSVGSVLALLIGTRRARAGATLADAAPVLSSVAPVASTDRSDRVEMEAAKPRGLFASGEPLPSDPPAPIATGAPVAVPPEKLPDPDLPLPDPEPSPPPLSVPPSLPAPPSPPSPPPAAPPTAAEPPRPREDLNPAEDAARRDLEVAFTRPVGPARTKALQDVVKKHPGTRAAGQAQLLVDVQQAIDRAASELRAALKKRSVDDAKTVVDRLDERLRGLRDLPADHALKVMQPFDTVFHLMTVLKRAYADLRSDRPRKPYEKAKTAEVLDALAKQPLSEEVIVAGRLAAAAEAIVAPDAFLATEPEKDPVAGLCELLGIKAPASKLDDADQKLLRNLALIVPQKEELVWLDVPWVLDLWEARRQATEKGRPILLWDLEGHPLGCSSNSAIVGRAAGFSDAEVIETLKQGFVVAAVDDFYVRDAQDAPGAFFHKVVDQGPPKDDKDKRRDGLYACTADGTLLGFAPDADAKSVKELLAQASSKWGDLPEKMRRKRPFKEDRGALDPRFERSPPEGGLALRVHARELEADGAGRFRRTAPRAAYYPNQGSLDHAWLTADEARAFLPDDTAPGTTAKVPARVARRLLWLHLVDDVRGEPATWESQDLKQAELTVMVLPPRRKDVLALRLSGFARLASANEKRTYDATITGSLEYDARAQAWVKFSIVAVGPSKDEEADSARPGSQPLGIAFVLADGKSEADKVPPGQARDPAYYFGR